MAYHIRYLLLLALLIFSSIELHAEIGASREQCISRYGKPEREGSKERGLLFFRKDGLCTIAHFYQGKCDVLSLFSDQEELGFPEELSDEKIASLLKSEGGSLVWNPVPRFTINGVWRSADNNTFAIYDTMRHKLVIMTHAAYVRENNEKQHLSSQANH